MSLNLPEIIWWEHSREEVQAELCHRVKIQRFLSGQIVLMFLNAAMLIFGKSFVVEQLFTPVLWLIPVRISTG